MKFYFMYQTKDIPTLKVDDNLPLIHSFQCAQKQYTCKPVCRQSISIRQQVERLIRQSTLDRCADWQAV